jgi:hypothetical protein
MRRLHDIEASCNLRAKGLPQLLEARPAMVALVQSRGGSASQASRRTRMLRTWVVLRLNEAGGRQIVPRWNEQSLQTWLDFSCVLVT